MASNVELRSEMIWEALEEHCDTFSVGYMVPSADVNYLETFDFDVGHEC